MTLTAALAALPSGYSAALSPADLQREAEMNARPTFARLNGNPVIAAMRAARQRVAVRLSWTTSPGGIALHVDGFRQNAKGKPTGFAHTVTLADGLTPATAVAYLNAL